MFYDWFLQTELLEGKNMSIVHVENLTHFYGDQLVFKDIEFRLLNKEKVVSGPKWSG